MKFSRREFLGSVGRGAALCALPSFVSRLTAGERAIEPRALVIVQLEGGNDGFNTFVPCASDAYHRARPTLALRKSELIFISDGVALNRAAGALEPLFKDGKLAVLENVGTAAQSPSHYRANEVWHTASADDEVIAGGWAARCAEEISRQGRAVSLSYAGAMMPRLFWSEAGRVVGRVSSLDQLAESIGFTGGTEIHFVSFPGFDTHYAQRDVHARALHTAANSIAAFQRRIEQRGVASRVLTTIFSEFNRTLAENAQGGTDHGGAGPVFLLGREVSGGLHAEEGEFRDFRHVIDCASVDWLAAPRRAFFVQQNSRSALSVFRAS